jgi:phage shock protein C
MESKKLYRSNTDKMIAGVCGGLGQYFGVDPTLIRLIFALLVVFGVGSGVLLYIVLAIVIPLEPA